VVKRVTVPRSALLAEGDDAPTVPSPEFRGVCSTRSYAQRILMRTGPTALLLAAAMALGRAGTSASGGCELPRERALLLCAGFACFPSFAVFT
jgi:hypothetical protein